MNGPSADLGLAAPAKINLHLHVTARRDDGYHLIDSVFAFVQEADRVTVHDADALTLDIDGPFATALGNAGDAGDNLVIRAARRLAEEGGVSARGAIRLTKNLPVAAGIGGGSADAAAALRLLDRLWGLDTDPENLARIGLALGADVPACLDGRALRATGVGERIAPLPTLPVMTIVMVNNGRKLDTAAVFGARSGPFSDAAPGVPDRFADVGAAAAWFGALGNDLLDAACALEPSIRDVLTAIEATEGCLLARLTGSGPTCFGIFADPGTADAAAASLAHDHPDWWIRASRFRDRPAAIEG